MWIAVEWGLGSAALLKHQKIRYDSGRARHSPEWPALPAAPPQASEGSLRRFPPPRGPSPASSSSGRRFHSTHGSPTTASTSASGGFSSPRKRGSGNVSHSAFGSRRRRVLERRTLSGSVYFTSTSVPPHPGAALGHILVLSRLQPLRAGVSRGHGRVLLCEVYQACAQGNQGEDVGPAALAGASSVLFGHTAPLANPVEVVARRAGFVASQASPWPLSGLDRGRTAVHGACAERSSLPRGQPGTRTDGRVTRGPVPTSLGPLRQLSRPLPGEMEKKYQGVS
ncbi:uncharacterized protein LOC129057615 [Pongo abelii]|uniref:uncharacterized protein LOC129057615 n=1 Tax=Pongo abelii TaxID=9601 RepID=UPI0023E8DC60|nr:uncharacterized protein LOC129057615 [Pongo abelii]